MSFPTSRLSTCLSKNVALDGAVKQSFESFRIWIQNSHLPFFPEYTDHGWNHITDVILSASGLISERAWDIVTPSDAAVLLMSVLLHDSAMHLSEDGFISLIKSDVPGIDQRDAPWSQLWKDFLEGVKRYDGKQLTRIFGENRPIKPPPENPSDYTRKDRLLIGEFIRKFHPRIAQEIAHYGVPSSSVDNKLRLDKFWGCDPNLLLLSGLVARSHGSSIRDSFEALKMNYDLREYRGVHPVFLMVLVRVADYLQLQRERAPGQILSIKNITTPISVGEWKAHEAIVDIRNTHDDPEAVFLEVYPKDAMTFLKIQKLTDGLQGELDQAWAVLGEVYGRIEGLKPLEIVLRRVRTSLENLDNLRSKISYIPRAASFKAADADLLKLLVEPLYGDKPEVGVRELLQNSLDAVRERIQYENDSFSMRENESMSHPYGVRISLFSDASEKSYLEISDDGIGMSVDTVINYFLTAGASFRRSEDWRKNFEDEGNSKILRAGRFGIGALAAFLIGSEVRVSTRHVSDSEGLEFLASVDADNVELQRVDREVGTTISILVKKSAITSLRATEGEDKKIGGKWDWYCHEVPAVVREVDGDILPPRYLVPKFSNGEDYPWRRIIHQQFPEILWTYSDFPDLICNGIVITDSLEFDDEESDGILRRNNISMPNISLLDPDANLPLNLQRTGLVANQYPFQEALVSSIIDDFLAFALTLNDVNPLPKKADYFSAMAAYPGSNRAFYNWRNIFRSCREWYISRAGFGYIDAFIINKRKLKSIFFLLPTKIEDECDFYLKDNEGLIHAEVGSSLSEIDYHVRSIFDVMASTVVRGGYWRGSTLHEMAKLKWEGACFFLSRYLYERYFVEGKLPAYLRKQAKSEKIDAGWLILIGNVFPQKAKEWKGRFAAENFKISERSVVGEFFRKDIDALQEDPSEMVRRWLELIGDCEIPFTLEDRKSMLRSSFVVLEQEIKRHEEFRRMERAEKSSNLS